MPAAHTLCTLPVEGASKNQFPPGAQKNIHLGRPVHGTYRSAQTWLHHWPKSRAAFHCIAPCLLPMCQISALLQKDNQGYPASPLQPPHIQTNGGLHPSTF